MTKALGIDALSLTPELLQLRLPLKPNLNHKGTLFGGSLYAGCAAACYGLFLASLEAQGIQTKDIVVAHGTIDYLSPVTQDCWIQARWPTPQAKIDFFTALKRKQKARVQLLASVRLQPDSAQSCVEFVGQFVAKML